MAKGKNQPKIENRREVALSKREAEQQKKILMALGGVGAVILVVLIIGLVYTYLVLPNQAVATVNGVKITRQDYQKRVLYERYLLDEQVSYLQLQYQQLAQSLQDDTSGLLDSLQQQANQQIGQAYNQRLTVDRDVLDTLIEEELAVAEAANRGLTVSDEDVLATYNDIVAGRSGGYTEAAAAETVTARTNATATAAMFTPTPTQEPKEGEAVAEPAPTLAPQPTPTINVLTGEDFTKATTDWETILRDKAKMTPADMKQIIYRGLLKIELRDAIGEEASEIGLQAHVRHILVAPDALAEAEAARARIEAGEAFEDVAAEVSIDTGTAELGGDLGWFSPGDMVEAFDEAAFNLDVGVLSEPIETQFGWHLIEVLAREERKLDQSGLARAKANAYADWLLKAKSGVEDFWSTDDAPPDDSPLVQQAQTQPQ